jgi:hypothetical protein
MALVTECRQFSQRNKLPCASNDATRQRNNTNKNMKNKTIRPLCKFKSLSTEAVTMLIQLACIIAVAIGIVIVVMGVAQAEPRHRSSNNHRESHNYILERQEAYQVQGVPTSRIIIGKREIDVYPNGLMFEKNNVVGVRSR